MSIQPKYKIFVWVLLLILLGSGEIAYSQNRILKQIRILNKIKEATKSDIGKYVNEIFEDETFKQGILGLDSVGININNSIRDSIISNNNKMIDEISIKSIMDAIIKNKSKNTSTSSDAENVVPKTYETRKLDNVSFEKTLSSSINATQRLITSPDDLPDFEGCLVKDISIFNTNAPYQQIAQFKYIYGNKKLLQISFSSPNNADPKQKKKKNSGNSDLNGYSDNFCG